MRSVVQKSCDTIEPNVSQIGCVKNFHKKKLRGLCNVMDAQALFGGCSLRCETNYETNPCPLHSKGAFFRIWSISDHRCYHSHGGLLACISAARPEHFTGNHIIPVGWRAQSAPSDEPIAHVTCDLDSVDQRPVRTRPFQRELHCRQSRGHSGAYFPQQRHRDPQLRHRSTLLHRSERFSSRPNQ